MRVFGVFLAATWAILPLCGAFGQEHSPDCSEPASSSIKAAVQKANQEGKLVLLRFGAEGCVYCEQLSRVLGYEDIHILLNEHFVQVRIDVGDFDENMDLFSLYMGENAASIPAIAVLGMDGSVMEAVSGKEWGESDQEVHDFIQPFLERCQRR